MKKVFFYLLSILILTVTSCDNNIEIPKSAETEDSAYLTGTGSFIFKEYMPFKNKNIKVFYHIPANANSASPVLIAMHGNERDGEGIRNAFIKESNNLGFIVVAPELSETYFPGSDSYHLGNVFEDGDNPSPSTLNKEEDWTFSMIEPLFEHIKKQSITQVSTFDLFGHSAGAQFAHRYLIYKPNTAYNRIVAASSGWYTVPDDAIDFPYGIKMSPAETLDLKTIFSKPLTILVGDKDIDPNSFGLRHNNFADAQGDNRYERAQYFFTTCQGIASAKGAVYNWKYKSIPGAGHDLNATSAMAVNVLYR